jgi:predicted DNA-binding transcriptional regulator AlpA
MAMPKPIRIYARRTVWDRKKVDAAFEALDTSDAVDDVWGRVAA